jgi:thiosulfate dehydrogenase
MDGRTLTAAAAAGGVALVAGIGIGLLLKPAAPPATAKAFAPPPDSAIPDNDLGKQVALGHAIFTDTARLAPQFVGNDLKCSNCHLDEGRRANAGPLWGAYVLYPQYRAKNHHVNTFAERMQECFKYSMNGRAPPLGDPVIVALDSYAAFLASGAPVGVRQPGQGYLRLPMPPLTPDYERGQAVYAANCTTCHGVDGAGQRAGGTTVFPPLWGERSFNWGAGMAEIDKEAGFIKANMPFGQGGKLTDQQAWDVAAYVDGKPRPQDPRYAGSVADTRRKFHDSPQSSYGLTVNGVLLGGDGPPKPSGGGPARPWP